LLWASKIARDYSVDVKNFTTSWRDGLAFCSIIHYYFPEKIDFYSLKKETEEDMMHNHKLAFDIAEEKGVFPILEPEDMMISPAPDKNSVTTYVSSMYKVFKPLLKGVPPRRASSNSNNNSPATSKEENSVLSSNELAEISDKIKQSIKENEEKQKEEELTQSEIIKKEISEAVKEAELEQSSDLEDDENKQKEEEKKNEVELLEQEKAKEKEREEKLKREKEEKKQKEEEKKRKEVELLEQEKARKMLEQEKFLQKLPEKQTSKPKQFTFVGIAKSFFSILVMSLLASFLLCNVAFNYLTYLLIVSVYGLSVWKPQYFSNLVPFLKEIPSKLASSLSESDDELFVFAKFVSNELKKRKLDVVLSYLEKSVSFLNAYVVTSFKKYSGQQQGGFSLIAVTFFTFLFVLF